MGPFFFQTPDTDVFTSTGIISIKSMILKNQMRWPGYIVRMTDEYTSKQLLHGELADGKCNRCKPKKRFKDGIRTTMESFGMDPKAKKALLWIELDDEDRCGVE